MNRNLAIGYLLTVITIATCLAILRGVINIGGTSAFRVSQMALLALLPASVLTFIGTKRSIGGVRKFLGFSVSAIDALIALGACIAIALGQ
jgi:hypothetical protein